MTVNKLTNPPTAQEQINKINEIIDNLGGGGGSVDIDGVTITTNSNDEIQTVAVKDNRSGNAIKTWTGTKAQYDAITTKDTNTLYNITDDTDVTLSLLELLYPIGSLYIATSNVSVCPLAVLGVGTWQQKANSTLVTDVNTIAPVVGNGMALGITTGTNNYGWTYSRNGSYGFNTNLSNSYGSTLPNTPASIYDSNANISLGVTSDATKSGIEANVTSTTLSVTIWERIS